MLAQISKPTTGTVSVAGSIAPLIEVGAGFVPDFTGRENVFLNGAILGMSQEVIARKFDSIVEFAEMSEFIDTPVKRYSSGMQVKLAFAVATSLEADILIVDEVLAVGDLAFQRKCFDRMEELIKREGKTVLLVSHNIRQVERLCSRVILLDHGRVLNDGAPRDICNQFYELNNDRILAYNRARSQSASGSIITTGEVSVLECELLKGDDLLPTDQFDTHDKMTVDIHFEAHVDIEKVDVVVGFHTTDLVYIATANTGVLAEQHSFQRGTHRVQCRFADIPLMPGVYGLRVGFLDRNARQMWYAENFRNFKVSAPKISVARASTMSLIDIPVSWNAQEVIDYSRTTKITSVDADA